MSPICREDLLRLIPHAGEMCLLDEITAWDAKSLRCRASCAQAPGNPLRRPDGTLGMACGIEIAGQAMAAHGRLTAGGDGPPLAGMLVSLRDVALGQGPLQAEELLIEVEQLMGDANGASYKFLLTEAGKLRLSGRATVLFSGGRATVLFSGVP